MIQLPNDELVCPEFERKILRRMPSGSYYIDGTNADSIKYVGKHRTLFIDAKSYDYPTINVYEFDRSRPYYNNLLANKNYEVTIRDVNDTCMKLKGYMSKVLMAVDIDTDSPITLDDGTEIEVFSGPSFACMIEFNSISRDQERFIENAISQWEDAFVDNVVVARPDEPKVFRTELGRILDW